MNVYSYHLSSWILCRIQGILVSCWWSASAVNVHADCCEYWKLSYIGHLNTFSVGSIFKWKCLKKCTYVSESQGYTSCMLLLRLKFTLWNFFNQLFTCLVLTYFACRSNSAQFLNIEWHSGHIEGPLNLSFLEDLLTPPGELKDTGMHIIIQ